MPRDVSAYQDDAMGVHESNKARTCSATCQGERWYLGSGDASMRGGGQIIAELSCHGVLESVR